MSSNQNQVPHWIHHSKVNTKPGEISDMYKKQAEGSGFMNQAVLYCIANRIRLVHRYSFSQRFYEPQRPYTAQKN